MFCIVKFDHVFLETVILLHKTNLALRQKVSLSLTVIIPNSVKAAFTLLSLNLENEKVGHDDAVKDDLPIATLLLWSQAMPLVMFITSERTRCGGSKTLPRVSASPTSPFLWFASEASLCHWLCDVGVRVADGHVRAHSH